MWRFLTGVKPPPQKKAKLSETDAWYEKEKRKRISFSNGQSRIHQGNQIHGFEIGTTWIFFFNFEHCEEDNL